MALISQRMPLYNTGLSSALKEPVVGRWGVCQPVTESVLGKSGLATLRPGGQYAMATQARSHWAWGCRPASSEIVEQGNSPPLCRHLAVRCGAGRYLRRIEIRPRDH